MTTIQYNSVTMALDTNLGLFGLCALTVEGTATLENDLKTPSLMFLMIVWNYLDSS